MTWPEDVGDLIGWLVVINIVIFMIAVWPVMLSECIKHFRRKL